jgi:hypothetical protein
MVAGKHEYYEPELDGKIDDHLFNEINDRVIYHGDY